MSKSSPTSSKLAHIRTGIELAQSHDDFNNSRINTLNATILRRQVSADAHKANKREGPDHNRYKNSMTQLHCKMASLDMKLAHKKFLESHLKKLKLIHEFHTETDTAKRFNLHTQINLLFSEEAKKNKKDEKDKEDEELNAEIDDIMEEMRKETEEETEEETEKTEKTEDNKSTTQSRGGVKTKHTFRRKSSKKKHGGKRTVKRFSKKHNKKTKHNRKRKTSKTRKARK